VAAISPEAPEARGSVEERLDRLESMEAARTVLARYASACDAQDLDDLLGLFAADSELDVPGQTWHGAGEVAEFYRQAFASDPTQKSHFITNVKVACVGVATVAIDSYFLYTAAGDTSSILGWGEYRDIVDTSGPQPVFRRKSIAIRRAVDVRQGWSLGSPEGSGPQS
jgi:uncharacterized protein (TIGR02246 family)